MIEITTEKEANEADPVVEITIKRDGQIISKITCDQYYFLVSSNGKIGEGIYCRSPFIAYLAMRAYKYALMAIEEDTNKGCKE